MLEIIPTTTLAQLKANNTSAADSFPGWLPGLAPAANVSRAPLDIPQKKYGHRTDWWQTGAFRTAAHPDIGIQSNDPAYCALTAACMKAQGFDGCFADWYGPGSFEDKSLMALKPELEKLGLGYALCVDGGIRSLKAATSDATRTAALLTVLAYARKVYFSSPAYLRLGSKPVILFFGFAAGDYDWTRIRSAMADSILIFRWERIPQYSPRPYADGYFGWTDNSEAWIQNLKAKCPGKLIVLGINGRFDNSDPVLCPWGVGQNKIIPAQGGLVLQNQLAIARAHPEIILTSFNTWNDYQEKSAFEPGIPSGASLPLAEADGILSWADPGPMFDRVDLYVSKNAVDLMPLAVSRGVLAVNLKPMEFDEGTYQFVLQAVGKPMVQNLCSNMIGTTLGWS